MTSISLMKLSTYLRGISRKLAVGRIYELMTSPLILNQRHVIQSLEGQAAQMIRERPGLIPIDVHLDTAQLVWLDVEQASFQESFFHRSVHRLLKENRNAIKVNTGIDFLARHEPVSNAMSPTGFIFHLSRCGSTLLSKALARSPHHVVMSEPAPLNKIWYFFKGTHFQESEYSDWKKHIYQNLLLALGRQRTREQKAYFVKFTSWNVVFLNFIKQVFPDVPCIFIYRTPDEVISSILKNKTGYLRLKNSALGAFLADCTIRDTEEISDLYYLERVLNRFFLAVLDVHSDDLFYINYNKISTNNLESILNMFNYKTIQNELSLVIEQFSFYSKIDDRNILFAPEKYERPKTISTKIQNCVNQRLAVLYKQLEQLPNTFH
jgi:hypothetical protein